MEHLNSADKETKNTENFDYNLYNKTLFRLGEMLKILKLGDNRENRNKLKSHCQYLSKLGRRTNLYAWVELLETASVAIADTNNDYGTTTKLIIKEIKEANENIKNGNTDLVGVSEKLQVMVPESYIQLMDLANICEEIETPKNHIFNSDLEHKAMNFESKYGQNFNPNNTIWNEEVEEKQPEVQLINQNIINDMNNEKDLLDIYTQAEEDWLNQGYFEDEDNQSTGIFLKAQEHITKINTLDSFQEINLLLDEQDDEQIQNNFENSNNLREDNAEIFDLLDDIQKEIDKETKEYSDEDISSLFDSLEINENTQNDNSFLEITEDIQNKQSSLEEINEIFKDTLSLAEEAENYINEINEINLKDSEDFPLIYDDFIVKDSTGLPLIYDDFTDLENVIESKSLFVSQREIEVIEIELGVVNLCYENFEELDTLIKAYADKKIVNWQELNELIDDKISSIKTISNPITVPVWQEETENTEEDIFKGLIEIANQTSSTNISNKKISKKNLKTTAPTKKSPFEQNMRVSVKQLDNLNNLIGEMVIRRNQLEEDQERLHQFLDNLLNYVQNLSDVGARMQDLYERSLLEGALLASREKNQAVVKAQLTGNDNPNLNKATPELDVLELDRFSGFHLLSQEIIELIVRVRESTSDIQFLVDETEQLGRNLRQITNQLQEEINKSRMVPFSQTADRLPRPVRDISHECQKEIELKIEGRDVLIDKMILDHLWDPIQQLVKNSITHGIEEPAVRRLRGKNPIGNITIRSFLQGPQTVISVSDDGAGIDPNKIKQKAIQQKLITKAQAANISTQEAYEFLFHPGFSTRDSADKHAGRGVGLDIVRNKVNQVRGTVSIDSHVGQGTTFTMRLPLTLSIGKALCCLNNNARIAFPMDGIEDTKEYSVKQIEVNAQGQKCIPWRNTLLPFIPLSSLLTYNRQMSSTTIYGSKLDNQIISIVILRGGNSLLAIEVDQVIGQEEIVIKQILGPLPTPKGIAGATVRSDGIVMPVGDVIELINIAQGTIPIPAQNEEAEYKETWFGLPKNQPLIMIVDDSIMVREMLKISFNKAGYRVEQARDGQEAWEKLSSGIPCDLVMCDIEMPRMNGLELLKHMQEDKKLSQTPLAILSSRASKKHQKIAADLGASAYLIKPYVEKELLDSTTKMLQGEVLLADSTRKVKEKINSTIDESNEQEITKVTRKNKKVPLVLIIDDSVVVREMLSMTFKKAGYQVEQARDGQDAWDQILGGLPCDLILCDIEMPRMNGLELLARMQQDEHLSSIPIAMVTSRGAEKHRKIAADLGAKAYFTKPYLEDELLQASQLLIKGEVLLNRVG